MIKVREGKRAAPSEGPMTYAFTCEKVSPSSSWDLGLFVLGLNSVLEAEI